jgi:hypothetical protein
MNQTINISPKWASALQTLEDAEREAFISHALEAALSKLTTQAALKALYPDPVFSDAELAIEKWKTVAEYPDFSVSTLGRVRRLGATRTLKLWSIQRGYRQVGLWLDGIERRFVAHLLVAQAFLPNPDLKPHVNHKDGNKANNRLSNLEWTTVKENNEHASSAGLRRFGTLHPMAIRSTPAGKILASAKRKLRKAMNGGTASENVA